MRLTPKLLENLNRVFDKDPGRFVALRIAHQGGLRWSVADGALTLAVGDDPAASLIFDLSQYTLRQLVDAIAAASGYAVIYLDPDRADLSALVLLDGEGDASQFNGDAIFGYTSLLWALLESIAAQLQAAKDQIPEAPRQLSTTTASGTWLDELGSYLKVPRLTGEAETQYGPRIIAEVLRPAANNIALERAIEDYTGQPCEVADVTIYRGVFPVYDGTISYDGTYDYATVGLPNYGLFDVSVAYDLLNGGDISTFLTTVRGIVDRLRASGTHLRALALSSAGTPIADSATAPTEVVGALTLSSVFAEAFSSPIEAFGGAAGVLGEMADALFSPTDAAAGTVQRQLTAANGAPITDDVGEPILISASALFV